MEPDQELENLRVERGLGGQPIHHSVNTRTFKVPWAQDVKWATLVPDRNNLMWKLRCFSVCMAYLTLTTIAGWHFCYPHFMVKDTQALREELKVTHSC